jgi:hypothetical protein
VVAGKANPDGSLPRPLTREHMYAGCNGGAPTAY